jgi:DNA gyrase subunit A
MKTIERTAGPPTPSPSATTPSSCSSRTRAKWSAPRIKEIRKTGRNAQGVRLIDLREGENLQGIAPVVSDGKDETEEA